MLEELAKILSPQSLLIVAIFATSAYAVVRGLIDRKKPESNGFSGGGMGIPQWLIIGPVQEFFGAFYKACEVQRNVKEMIERNQVLLVDYQKVMTTMQTQQCENQKAIIEILRLVQDDTKKFGMAQIMHTKLLEDIRNDMLVRPGTPRQMRKRDDN